MKFDVSKVKKIREDSKSTTLKTPDGHQLIVAHHALSPSMRKQLREIPRNYAEGGAVEEDPTLQQKIDAANLIDEENQLEKRGRFNPFGLQSPQEDQRLSAARNLLGKEGEQPTSAPPVDQNSVSLTNLNPAAQGTRMTGPAPASLGAPSMAPAAPPPAAPAADPSVGALGAEMGLMQSGVAKQQAGLKSEADALGQQGAAEAAAIQGSLDFTKELQGNFQKEVQAMDAENNAILADIKAKHINPNRYMESMTGSQRVATTIGLILGGIGNAFTGSGNPALKILNQQIDRDIEAQKAELGKQENLLSYNLKRFGNMADATNVTVAMRKNMLADQLLEAAAKAKDQLAKSRALQAAGKLQMEAAPLYAKVAEKKAVASMLGGNQASGSSEAAYQQKLNVLRTISPDHYKEATENYIPGVGVAAIKPSDKDKEKISTLAQIKGGLAELQARAIKHGTTVPGSEADRVNKALASDVMLTAKESYNLGVLAKADLDILEEVIPNPGSFMTKATVAQLDATKKRMASQEEGLLKKLGVSKFQTSASSLEGRTATDPKGNRVIMKNGQWVPYGG